MPAELKILKDKTKSIQFQSRNSDPESGRWVSKDPIGFAGGDTNLYGYVLQDPVNFVDPSGLARCTFSKGGILSCQSNDGNRQYSTSAFSGSPLAAKIPAGQYKIVAAKGKPDGFFSLSRGTALDKIYQIGKVLRTGSPVRGGFMIHPGRSSEGCITIDKSNLDALSDYANIQSLLYSELGDSSLEVLGE